MEDRDHDFVAETLPPLSSCRYYEVLVLSERIVEGTYEEKFDANKYDLG